MKLTDHQYYYVYFCMFEETAMLKPLSYLSEFVSIRQPSVLLTDNASFKTYEQAVQMYLCQCCKQLKQPLESTKMAPNDAEMTSCPNEV